MKKIFYYILPLLAVAACSKEQMPETPAEPEGVYNLTVATPESVEGAKTTIGKEGTRYKIYWANGDKISAGTGNVSNALSGVTSETASVTFSFGKSVASGALVRCPGVDDPTKVTIPATQTSFGGQYDASANPMWGSVSTSGTSVPGGKVVLNNAMAMLRFAITGDTALDHVIIESVGGETINGTFAMSNTGVISGGTGATARTTINFSSPLALGSEAVNLYIPVRPQTYANGFKMALCEADGKYMQVSFFKTGQALTSANLAEFSVAYAPSREPVELKALAVLGSEEASYQDDKPANGIRVGTYNVWSDKDRADKVGSREDKYIYRQWSYARDAVAALVASMDCDVICFNEISSNTCKDSGDSSLKAAIQQYTSEYTYSMKWPNAVDEHWWETETYYTFAQGFAYKSSKLTLNSSGKFWLNSSGSTSSDDDSGGKRTCVWMKFTQKSTSKVFYVAVTHLSIKDQGADDGAEPGEWNLKTAKYLASYLKTRSGATNSDAIILVGDMNSSKTTTCQGFNYLVNAISEDPNTNLPFTDARDYLAGQDKLSSSEKGLPGTSVSTWNMGSNIKGESHRYDHIMFRNVNVSNYKSYKKTFTIDADESATPWYPSDHLPVSVDVVLK